MGTLRQQKLLEKIGSAAILRPVTERNRFESLVIEKTEKRLSVKLARRLTQTVGYQ
jgi:hypothetical protein